MNTALRSFLGAVVALLVLAGLTMLAHVLTRRVFDMPYWRWYLASGSFIGILTSFLNLGGSKKDDLGLISWHPSEYFGAWMHAWFPVLDGFGAALQQDKDAPRSIVIDRMLGTLQSLILVPIIAAWFIVVLPGQYVMFLVCGAFSRVAPYGKAPTPYIVTKEGAPLPPLSDPSWLRSKVAEDPLKVTSAYAALVGFALSKAL